MLVYILKSVACLAIFYVFYKIFLEKENMHVFKRFYLLGALLLSMSIPALVFTEYVKAPEITPSYETVKNIPVTNEVIGVTPALEADVLDIEPILWTIYFLGLLFFGVKFIRNLYHIFRRIRKNPKQKRSRFTQVLLQEKISPHTFFSYIFLNKKKLESNEIPTEVLLHEETHAQQKHSYDVIFVELLQVVFWINPFVYLIKKSVKLNHEFLADQAVLKKNINKTTYQNTLLSYLSRDSEKKYQPKLANAINYSSIKKRFTIMKTQTSKKAILFKSLLLLPLLAALLYGFSETKIETIVMDSVSETTTTIQSQKEPNQPNNENLIEWQNSISSEQKGASNQQLKEYNRLAKKYNQQKEGDRTIKFEDVGKLYSIYKLMTVSQKEAAEPFPNIPPPPPPMESQEEIDTIKTYKTPSGEIITIKKNASKKELKEYNALAKKYNNMLSKSKSVQIKMKDVNRLEYIYGLMSEKQKADAEPFADFPEPPLPPKAPQTPDHEQMEKAIGLEEQKIQEQERLMEERERLMEHQEARMHEQEILMEKEEVRIKELEAKIEEKQEIITEENIQVYQHHAGHQPERKLSMIDNVKELAKKDANFYLDDEKISTKQGMLILKNRHDISVFTFPWTNKPPEVKIYEMTESLPPFENMDNSKLKEDLEEIEREIQRIRYIKGEVDTDIPSPPTPPTPKSPLDHVIDMAKKGATFFLEGKEISSDEAIDIMKTNKDININSRASNGSKPVVKMSANPIVIEN